VRFLVLFFGCCIQKIRLFMAVGGICERMSKNRALLLFTQGLLFLLGSQMAYPLAESAGPGGVNVKALHELGYTGRGIRIGVLSQRHCRTSHEAFFEKDSQGNPTGDSHAHWYDPTGDVLSPYEPYWHDTSLAGIAASRGGREYPACRGIAPDAEICSAKVTRRLSQTDPNRTTNWLWFQDALNHFRADRCRIVVTGIQLPNDYDRLFPFTLLYDYYAYTDDIFFANASGNDNASITIFGTSFNGLTTAGLITVEPEIYRRVGTAVNPGPTLDNRRKPETAAPAQNLWVPTSSGDTAWKNEGTTRGETSWAAPHTAGVAAVLLQYADQSEEPDGGRSVVLKAVLVNSAVSDIQDKNGLDTAGRIWHPQRGYGRLDAKRAFSILSSPKIVPETEIAPSRQPAGWAFQSLSAGKAHIYTWTAVPDRARLVLTLAWKRRVRWLDRFPPNNIIEKGELTGYLANLDLLVEDEHGRPVFSDTGTLDNLKKADILIPKTGQYRLRVVNRSFTESAEYAMAYEIIEPPPDAPEDVVDKKVSDALLSFF